MGYADELQAVSVDEALIDVTGAVRARQLAPEEAEEGQYDISIDEAGRGPRDAALEIAEKIRADVRRLTDGCEGASRHTSPSFYVPLKVILLTSGSSLHWCRAQCLAR